MGHAHDPNRNLLGAPVSELVAYYHTIVPSLRVATRQSESELRGLDSSGVGIILGEEVSRSVEQSLNLQNVGKRLQGLGGQISSVGDSLTKYIRLPSGLASTAVTSIRCSWMEPPIWHKRSGQSQLASICSGYFLGKVLADQSVSVFVDAALPRAPWISAADLQNGGLGNGLVIG